MENYTGKDVIGEGTYGVVIKSKHKETGQVVAIKKFKESDEDEQVRKTSLREVRVLKQLRHDNVITLLEVFRRNGKLYLVFEYVENTILELLERKPNGLDDIEVKKYMYQLIRGVDYCHSHNIIHRDVKPENILISKGGALKLCDFGFARPMSIGGKYTDYVATRWYRSPELLVGDVEYGKGVDVWAIGCIFAEISNGIPLFPGESDIDQLAHIMRCFGKLTSRQVQIFRRNPLYVGVELPVPREYETLETRFQMAPKNWLGFLKACLKNDPEQRDTCSGLLSLPYFTDRNFRTDYEVELKMLMDKEKSMNLLRKENQTPSGEAQAQAQMQQPVSQAQAVAQPMSSSDATMMRAEIQMAQRGTLGMNTVPSNQLHLPKALDKKQPQQQGPGSLWSQYLASATTTSEFPDLAGGKRGDSRGALPSTVNSQWQQPKNTPSGGSGSQHSNNPNPYPHSYLSNFTGVEPMMVTNASKPQQQGMTSLGSGSGQTFPTLQQPKTKSTLSFPSLGGNQAQHQAPSMGSNLSQPVQRENVVANSSLASQLSYKKKPQKRNVLSTLSLSAYGSGNNQLPPSQPSFGLDGGHFMMLQGQGHSSNSNDHQMPNSRRTSKPWM